MGGLFGPHADEPVAAQGFGVEAEATAGIADADANGLFWRRPVAQLLHPGAAAATPSRCVHYQVGAPHVVPLGADGTHVDARDARAILTRPQAHHLAAFDHLDVRQSAHPLPNVALEERPAGVQGPNPGVHTGQEVPRGGKACLGE